MKCQLLFSEKNKKHIIDLYSAKFAHSILGVCIISNPNRYLYFFYCVVNFSNIFNYFLFLLFSQENRI